MGFGKGCFFFFSFALDFIVDVQFDCFDQCATENPIFVLVPREARGKKVWCFLEFSLTALEPCGA